MNNLPELSHPVLFFLSLPFGILAVYFSLRGLRVVSDARKWTISVLRMGLVLVLLLYLAGPQWTVSRTVEQETSVLLDSSYSVSPSTWKRTFEELVQVRNQSSDRNPFSLFLFGENYKRVLRNEEGNWSGDPSGWIEQGRSFGEEAEIKRLNPYQSRLHSATSDVDGLTGRDNRTVVLTDGYAVPSSVGEREWRSDFTERRVTMVPISGGYESNVTIQNISAPRRIRAGEPVTADVTVSSTHQTQVRLAVQFGEQQTKETDLKLKSGEPRTVQVGPVLPFAGSPPDAKSFVEIAATLKNHSDSVTIDDEARTGLVVYPPLRVLALSSGEQPAAIEQAMIAQGLDVERIREPTGERVTNQLTDANLVLINSPQPSWVNDRIERSIRSFVRTDGGGLLVVPGTGENGYNWFKKTRLSSLFPVEPLPREDRTNASEPGDSNEGGADRKSEPDPDGENSLEKGEVATVSLMLVIDTSGSMTGKKLGLVKEAAIAAIETLDPDDRIGVLAFDHRRRWITRPITASRTDTFKKRIAKLKAGGGTRIVPAIKLAGKALRNEKAGIKHMILLSDGSGELTDYKSVVQKLRKEDVTISTVATGDQVQLMSMLNIAEWGGGNMYEPKSFDEVPQIFTTEARAVVKASEKKEQEQQADERPSEALPTAAKDDESEDASQETTSTPDKQTGPLSVRTREPAPFLKGLDASELPPVQSILPTSTKRFSFISLEAGSEPSRPLVGYRYSGTGMAGMILTGLNRTNAPDWITWDSFPQFVGQYARFLARERSPELLQPSYDVEQTPGAPAVKLNVSVPELKRKEMTADQIDLSWRGAAEADWNRAELKRVSNHEFQTKLVRSTPGAFVVFRLDIQLENGRDYRGFHFVPSTVPEEFTSKGVNRSFFDRIREREITVTERLQTALRSTEPVRRREKKPIPHWPIAVLSIVILVDIYLMKTG